jgi:putative SOS response-associated peptidase YedK
MCYDIKTSFETQLKRARRFNDEEVIREIEEKLLPYLDHSLYHASGYSHPSLLIYTNDSPHIPIQASWGLVPHWVKDNIQRKKIWNNTLNARGETIFEKPSFRESARYKRCLIYVDGFYEHHHFKGKTYPFFIKKKNNEPVILAGLWSDWVDVDTGEIQNTFSIVTTKGNNLLKKIHNNPKLAEPRMPLILPEEIAENWIIANLNDGVAIESMQKLIQPFPDGELESYTVSRLRGKQYLGNVEETSKPFRYEDLIF